MTLTQPELDDGRPLRVAVIGASGIGRHHARWWHLCGCDVAAFVGTSEASCAKTRAALTAYFGFKGNSYTDVARMLETERPDIVDVASPNDTHLAHCEAALDAGCHVLCEKPLWWQENASENEIVERAGEVVAKAEAVGRRLGMSAQYPAAIEAYQDVYRKACGSWDPVASVFMEMEVTGGDRPRPAADVWTDVASHPISLALALVAEAEVAPGSLACRFEGHACYGSFDMTAKEARCGVSFVLRDIGTGTPRRRFGANDLLVDWEGFADPSGVYRARLVHNRESVECEDFMHTLIGRFADAVRSGRGELVVDGTAALRNLRIQAQMRSLATEA